MKVIAISSILALTLAFGQPLVATAIDTGYAEQLGLLEKQLLSTAYEKDPLPRRVERLEKLVFGEVRTGPIEERIVELTTTVPPAKAPADAQTEEGEQEQAQDQGQDQADSQEEATEKYPRVTALEEAVLGKTYTHDDLSDRLARMEEKLYGKVEKDEDLGDRTDKIQAYVEKTMKKPLFQPDPKLYDSAGAQQQQQEEVQPKRSKVPGIINAVSTALFGPVMAPGMGNAMSPAMGTMGFGGIRVRNRADVQAEEAAQEAEAERKEEVKEAEARANKEIEDLVMAKKPPPPGSKTLVKLSWCEQMLFGRSYPQMHLTKRLEALNKELAYKPGLTGIQLMDDVDGLVATVYKKKGPAEN